MSTMGDEFEDFPSDDDYSEDADDLQLDDNDLARVWDGLGAVPNQASSTAALVLNGVSQPVAQAQQQELCGEGPSEEQVLDFDRFLEAFTSQQSRAPDATNVYPSTTRVEPQSSYSVDGPEVHGSVNEDVLHTADNNAEVKTAVAQQCQAQPSKRNTLLSWGVFSPDTMPARRELSSLYPAKTTPSPSQKLNVHVPSVAFLRTKKRSSYRRSTVQPDRDFTFRPKINKDYFRRGGLGRLRVRRGIQFSQRMQQDINERLARQQRREDEKRRQEQQDECRYEQRRRSLVAKGSQVILERNGLWDEPHDKRLQRLLQESKPRSNAKTKRPISDAKKRQRQEKEIAKARACEALYRRGLTKLERVKAVEKAPPPAPMPALSSRRRSAQFVREKMEREVSVICKHDANDSPIKSCLPAAVSFVEFSCVLLYFGLVPDANTLCKPGAAEGETLLWHAWMTLSQGEGENRYVTMTDLKAVLETIILKTPSLASARATAPRCASPAAKLKARLIDTLRLHYLARKRPTSSDNKTSKQDFREKANGNRVRSYSLHGRAIRSRASDDFLASRHEEAQRRIAELRKEKEAQEFAQCTFHPRVLSPSKSQTRNLLHGYSFTESAPETFDRLYSDFFVRQSNLSVRHQRAKMEEAEKWKKEMRISPTYVNGMTVEERLQKLHESLSNNALPVQFHAKIQEMRQAYATKVEEAEEKVRRLEPAAHEYPRTKEGRTLVVPFTLATKERGERTQRRQPANRNKTLLTTKKTQSTSTLIRELRLNYASPKAAGASELVDADLCIDVHVSPFETYQLCLNRDDDVYEAVGVFGGTYNLDDGQMRQLQQHAEATLKELVDL